jgi:hypothetical protein
MFGARTKMACSGHTGQAEGSEELKAGLMRDRGSAGCDPKLVQYVCHVAVGGVLADHRRGLRRYTRLSFAGMVGEALPAPVLADKGPRHGGFLLHKHPLQPLNIA